ncbi:hypothetical protein ACWDF9_08060 [Streptomyces rubiginosohelvolus]
MDSADGIHPTGSLSAFDQFVFAVRATSDRSALRSLEQVSRRSGVQS